MTIQEQLRRDEGLKLKPYRDSVDKLTIGVGRNLTDCGISEAEANFLLRNDIANVIADLERNGYQGDTEDPRYAVLINMGFNLGVPGLLAFKNFLSAYRAADYATASTEMLDSVWAKQVGDRAHRLSQQMLLGEWQ